MTSRTTRKLLPTTLFLLKVAIIIAIFNVFNGTFHEMSKETSVIVFVTRLRQQISSSTATSSRSLIERNDATHKIPEKTNITASNSSTRLHVSSSTTTSTTSSSSMMKENSTSHQMLEQMNSSVSNSSARLQVSSSTTTSTTSSPSMMKENSTSHQMLEQMNSSISNSSAHQQVSSSTTTSTTSSPSMMKENSTSHQMLEQRNSSVSNSSVRQQVSSSTTTSTTSSPSLIKGNNTSHQMLEQMNSSVSNSSTRQQVSPSTTTSTTSSPSLMRGNDTSHKISKKLNDTVNNGDPHKKNSSNTTTSSHSPRSAMKGNVTYYNLANDIKYHYEFRFEHNSNNTNDDPRLMILFNGSVRTCVDYWDFAVGRRILDTLRAFRFSILVICSKKKTYNPVGPVQKNPDVKWIYLSLQKWMSDVYYKQFQRYPRLYIHGISRGSKIAALLCRVLPIQQQIFTIFPGHWDGLVPRSDYPVDLQRRLQLDPVFANWFYFDFCYKSTTNKNKLSQFCPFQSERHHYQPVPPTYFIHAQNDRLLNIQNYTLLINRMRRDAFNLGGKLLNDTEGVMFHILSPCNATPTYMQETFDTWHSKPRHSAIFYEHYANRSLYNASYTIRQTCQCFPIDFRYYELHPNITQAWPKQKQDEYKDYANDIARHIYSFCEDVCGDLHTDHAMSSRHLDKALEWVDRMDSLRRSLLIEDYLARPLRVWMYDKKSIMTNTAYFTYNEPDYVKISPQYHMYSPEYYLQDYLLQLKASSTFSRHNLQWANNPLLADYFIIPSDLTYYYFLPDVSRIDEVEYQNLVNRLNTDYFGTMLKNIRTAFPFWTMAKQADQVGSNHILTILAGRNMGIFYNHTRKILKNVIQLVFTGLRQDLLPPDAPPPRDYRGMPIVYRHGYDVVIPQFSRLSPNSNGFLNMNVQLQNKKRLMFFAGALHHSMTLNSARPSLRSVWNDMNEKHKYNTKTVVAGKQYDTLTIIEGHQMPYQYIESIQSSVFALCPEGYFPWSPRFYEALQLGAIPMILADNIVLPFERFIDWPSFSAKINVSNIGNIIDLVQRIDNLEQYMREKLTNAQPYVHAFRWPYSAVGENGHKRHVFLPDEDKKGSSKNVFHYISLELRCRRLEQLYGLTSESVSQKSIDAQREVCTAHPTVCPCHDTNRSLAFRQYL